MYSYVIELVLIYCRESRPYSGDERPVLKLASKLKLVLKAETRFNDALYTKHNRYVI